jgi:hypothetical protein
VTSFDNDGKARKKKADPDNQGSIIIGTAGVLHVPHVAAPKLYPVEKFKGYALPALDQGHHWSEWAEACKTRGPTTCNFDYSGALAEAVLLGDVSYRAGQQKLEWDAEALKAKNSSDADQFIRREYRKGWELKA